ncbi:hypothetical protein [Streptomyces sp. NPDC048111]|uniref:hypothetical protein n=1 Tax=Streptomyces sp. NPDC048111 TaxID=3365500 RepID=UPI003721B226
MDIESREQLLQSAGLTVLDAAWSGEAPEPMEAWRLIIGGEVTPSAIVGFLDGCAHLDEVQSQWESFAEMVESSTAGKNFSSVSPGLARRIIRGPTSGATSG